MPKLKLKKKQRHQLKSRWDYLFWGAATVSVFAGQMYVGSGYRRMSKSIDRILEAPIRLDMGVPDIFHKRHPMVIPGEPMYDFETNGI